MSIKVTDKNMASVRLDMGEIEAIYQTAKALQAIQEIKNGDD